MTSPGKDVKLNINRSLLMDSHFFKQEGKAKLWYYCYYYYWSKEGWGAFLCVNLLDVKCPMWASSLLSSLSDLLRWTEVCGDSLPSAGLGQYCTDCSAFTSLEHHFHKGLLNNCKSSVALSNSLLTLWLLLLSVNTLLQTMRCDNTHSFLLPFPT